MTKDNAKELLLTLIYPRCEDDLTDEEKAVLDEAAACQAEYGVGESVVGEKVGDVSVTYSLPAKITLCGVPSHLRHTRSCSARDLSPCGCDYD